MISICVVLELVSNLNLDVEQLEAKTTFFHDSLEEEIYSLEENHIVNSPKAMLVYFYELSDKFLESRRYCHDIEINYNLLQNSYFV